MERNENGVRYTTYFSKFYHDESMHVDAANDSNLVLLGETTVVSISSLKSQVATSSLATKLSMSNIDLVGAEVRKSFYDVVYFSTR